MGKDNIMKFAFRKNMLLLLLKQNLISNGEYSNAVKILEQKFNVLDKRGT